MSSLRKSDTWLGTIIDRIPEPSDQKAPSSPTVISLPKRSEFKCCRCDVSFTDYVDYKRHFKDTLHMNTEAVVETPTNGREWLVHGRIQVHCADQNYYIWSTIVADKKTVAAMSYQEIIRQILKLRGTLMLLILYRSGKFAGGVFDLSGKMLVSKSLKKYTVRAGQGGAQSKMGGSKSFNSAGSQMRSQNETKLAEETCLVLESWGSWILQCGLMFWNFSPSGQKALFSSEKSPVFHLKSNFRELPFETFDPTIEELQRSGSIILQGSTES